MSELGKLVDIEKSEISSNLNASILNAFGMGMYVVIYIGTMYIYLTRSASKRYIVPATITVLFVCNIVITGVNWYTTKWQFVDNGETRNSVFASLFDIPRWVNLASDIPYFISFVLADALLIWRCFFVWNRSFRVILVSLLFIIAETALFFVRTVLQAIYGAIGPNAASTARINSLSFAGYFMTVATSFVTTVLTAYRIYSVSKHGVSERKFTHIINIVVQSGVVYSLSLLVATISPVVAGGANVSNVRIMALGWYSAALVNVIAGISATILVARVSMLTTTTTFPSTTIQLSGLQFNTYFTRKTDPLEEMEVGHPVGINSISVDDVVQIVDKVQ